MGKYANYIKRIEIDNLWNRLSVKWELRPDVNILSGINGIGKTTILNRVIQYLEEHETQEFQNRNVVEEVKVTLEPTSASSIPYNVIRSYDRPLLLKDMVQKAYGHINSELDWQLYLLQRRYLDYQVNISNRMIELLSSGDIQAKEKALDVVANKQKFLDIIDDLFSYTGKKINRVSNEISFTSGSDELLPYQLSSGEKQILLIYLTALVQDKQHYVLLMDEPEASLHIDWQQRLISTIRDLNPNVQIIMTTHSPAVIMEGWVDAVTEVSDISNLK